MRTIQNQDPHRTGKGSWIGPESAIRSDPPGIKELLEDLTAPVYFLHGEGTLSAVNQGEVYPTSASAGGRPLAAYLRPQRPADFGDAGFLRDHGLSSPYMAGAMANGISGEELVIAMGKAGYLASYGAGGVSPPHLQKAISRIKSELGEKPFAFNLIHSPHQAALEQALVDLYLQEDINTIEASAFLKMTPTLVQYRASGLRRDSQGRIRSHHKIIAKLSRREVALQFLEPAPDKILRPLVAQGRITSQQAELAASFPIADDITVEADSGGHTDNRPLTSLLPSLMALRDEIQEKRTYPVSIRIGAAGGIGTPASALAAFAMGADYIVTGSVNQSCLEAATSRRVKTLLAEAAATDVMMAPAADMFEMGVNVQVLKRGSMFPLRAQKLYEIYRQHESITELAPGIRTELEEKYFQRSLDEIWQECVQFFSQRDPEQLQKAEDHPKRQMALIFRWYLGLATHWGIQGDPQRAYDYQIWCGPSMGAFNDWVRGTWLENPENRSVVSVADALLQGAAYLYRLTDLRLQGIRVPTAWNRLIN